MKVLELLIIASIITYAAARVAGPQVIDARKKSSKPQIKQEDDVEGVDVDSDIPVANIQVFSGPSSTTSLENDSTESSIATSSSVETTSAEITESPVLNEDDQNPINRYCRCSSFECDCCRDFSLPLVPIRGPGCANIRYLDGDRLSIGIKFGNRILANRIVSGRKSTPVCLPLPGGFTNFCGRIYGISKKNENFKACLGLELRADEEVEAALRVSCFDFGPRGLRVTEAEPIPAAPIDEEDDDDDDDDIFGGLVGDDDDDILGDDDDDSEDDDTPTGQSAGQLGQPGGSSNDDDDDDDVDYTGLSLLSGDFLEDILGDDDDSSDNSPTPSRKNIKKKKVTIVPEILNNSEQNDVEGGVNDGQLSIEETRPVQDSSDDDDDDEEEEDGGILGILDDLISDGDDDESAEEQLEDEISEEVVQNELEDDAEDVAEDVEDSTKENQKDTDDEDENDLDEQALEETVVDDDDDDEEEDELDEKPTSYSGLSLLGLRKFFSRFFH